MRKNLIIDVCTLWLLLPMIKFDRVMKEPTDTCTKEEFEEIAEAAKNLKKSGSRVDLGNALVLALGRNRKIRHSIFK